MIGSWLPSIGHLAEAAASQRLAPQHLMARIEVGKINHHATGSTREKLAGCPHITGSGMGRTGSPSKRGDKMSCQGARSLWRSSILRVHPFPTALGNASRMLVNNSMGQLAPGYGHASLVSSTGCQSRSMHQEHLELCSGCVPVGIACGSVL